MKLAGHIIRFRNFFSSRVQAMKLACCNLRAVPDAVCVMSQLRFLDLSMNEQLDSLPLGAYLDHLETLELSRCCFTRVGLTLLYFDSSF